MFLKSDAFDTHVLEMFSRLLTKDNDKHEMKLYTCENSLINQPTTDDTNEHGCHGEKIGLNMYNIYVDYLINNINNRKKDNNVNFRILFQ